MEKLKYEIAKITETNQEIEKKAYTRLAEQARPAGSLGMLEHVGAVVKVADFGVNFDFDPGLDFIKFRKKIGKFLSCRLFIIYNNAFNFHDLEEP
ncbi:MAG: nicotinate-nucleotide--dimethylbenzimidazole phosphoribosyltransferase [Desulfobacteraceae bacterium]|nr:nicotinate-nucleotide--dimethylbenzimidazole phosphoribosyltransferase [Desulfobacteraceae bacterium]